MAVSNQSQLERDLFNMTRPKSVKKDPKRIRLTVREKLCILDRLGKGEKQCEIVKSTGLSKAAVSSIKKNSETLRKLQTDNSPLLQSKCTLLMSKYPQVDKMVFDWFVDVRHPLGKRKPLPLSHRINQPRAKRVASQLGFADFNASNGWFQRWRMRFNIGKNVNLHGEAADIDFAEAEIKMNEIRKKLAEAGYKPEHIFNMDETGLYYRCLPTHSYTLQSGDIRQVGRGTMAMKAKDRLTLVLCFNATGTCKIAPLLVGTSKQFRGKWKLNSTFIRNWSILFSLDT